MSDIAIPGNYVYVADWDPGFRIYQGWGTAEISKGPVSECKVGSLKLQIAGSRITYQLPQDEQATIKVYSLLGQEVRTLVNEIANGEVTKLRGAEEPNAGMSS